MQPHLKKLVILGVVLTACSKSPNAPDATTSLSGHWISSDTVEVFTALDLHILQNDLGLLSGNWVGKTRITNGKCDATYGCAPANGVSGSNLALRIDLEILGVGSFDGQLSTQNDIQGKIVRFGIFYPLHLRKTN